MDSIEKTLKDAEDRLTKAQAHAEREAIFAQQANIRFANNITAFEKYFPDLAEEVKNYCPRDDFCIHVTESGHGNFFLKNAEFPLYGDDPWKQSEEQVEKNTTRPFFSSTSYGSKGDVNDDEILHIRYMQKLNKKLYQIKQKEDAPITNLPEFFPSGMIFGLGLGYHVPILLEKHRFDYLFICEPDIELFFASLFCIDWFEIIQTIDEQGGCLFLNVGVSYEEFFNVIRGTVNDIGAFSLIKSFCYQHYPSPEVNKQIKDFFDRYFELQMGFGFYNDAITGLAHTIHNIENKAKFFYVNQQLKDAVKGVPVYIIGNGPSLDEAEELIKATQQGAILIAAGTALNSLLRMGITPDFHVLVERPKGNFDILLDTLPKEEYAKLNLLSVDVVYPDTLDLYKWSGLALKGPEAGSEFLNLHSLKKFGAPMNSLPYCAPLVANTALSFAFMFGFKEIYLFGVDNGYPVEGASHSKYSIYNDKDSVYSTVVDHSAPYVMEGNLGGEVKATSLLKLAKVQMDGLLALAPDLTVYNIGDGAKIEGAISATVDDIMPCPTLANKDKVVEKIKTLGFMEPHFVNSAELVDFDQFNEICDHLVHILDQPYNSRLEAADILKRQSRYIYSFRGTKFTYLFNMLKGSLLYYHCPMVTLLFTYEDEATTLEYFAEVAQLWREFILAMKQDFSENWYSKCEWAEYEI